MTRRVYSRVVRWDINIIFMIPDLIELRYATHALCRYWYYIGSTLAFSIQSPRLM